MSSDLLNMLLQTILLQIIYIYVAEYNKLFTLTNIYYFVFNFEYIFSFFFFNFQIVFLPSSSRDERNKEINLITLLHSPLRLLKKFTVRK